MSETRPDLPAPQTLAVGSGDEQRTIAFRHRTATDAAAPGLVWLGGFKSDMDGSKALALDSYAEHCGLGFTRFDYSGHGLSRGSFLDGTISRWLDEAEAVVRATSGADDRRILVGSSMGGWLALLLNRRLHQTGGPQIAWDEMSEASRAELRSTGRLEKPSDYSDEPYILTLGLIEDGKQHLFGSALIETGCPVHILQGALDTDVPPPHALKLASQMPLDDVVLSLIPDGDHRLSRPQDLQRLTRSIDTLLEGIAG